MYLYKNKKIALRTAETSIDILFQIFDAVKSFRFTLGVHCLFQRFRTETRRPERSSKTGCRERIRTIGFDWKTLNAKTPKLGCPNSSSVACELKLVKMAWMKTDNQRPIPYPA